MAGRQRLCISGAGDLGDETTVLAKCIGQPLARAGKRPVHPGSSKVDFLDACARQQPQGLIFAGCIAAKADINLHARARTDDIYHQPSNA
ncbi:MAG: hypothetical protein P1V21_00990 [Rhizobiaceae bacterium]|nr:hypothetical protein [Rhizobiaceae bacterium]